MKLVKNNIYWVGKVDWELRTFHGRELSTHRGTTYNSYLVREEKTALIDTVWAPFSKEFISALSDAIDLKKIDLIIASHGEIDHSSSLPELMSIMPHVPIYCTANGAKSIRAHYHKDWDFRPVKTGDRLSLGKKELVFIEAPMLHWPDSMFCYLTGDNVLFSSDAFGQHYATDRLFNDLVDEYELFYEAMKYYANILTPFSRFVDKKIKEFASLKLPLDVICTSHGAIWRKDPMQIVNKYAEWANNYREDHVAIIYDSMWDGTRLMAERIAEGIRDADEEARIKVFNISKDDKNDVVTEVFKSKGIVVGSPTINRGILYAVAGLLEEIKGLQFGGKKAASFGCYGWSGESTKIISGALKNAGFDVLDDGLTVLWRPDSVAEKRCLDYGRKIGNAWKT